MLELLSRFDLGEGLGDVVPDERAVVVGFVLLLHLVVNLNRVELSQAVGVDFALENLQCIPALLRSHALDMITHVGGDV